MKMDVYKQISMTENCQSSSVKTFIRRIFVEFVCSSFFVASTLIVITIICCLVVEDSGNEGISFSLFFYFAHDMAFSKEFEYSNQI